MGGRNPNGIVMAALIPKAEMHPTISTEADSAEYNHHPGADGQDRQGAVLGIDQVNAHRGLVSTKQL